MLRLHGWWSTNPSKVRLALEDLELEYAYQTVDLFKRENYSDAHLALNPNGTIPALETPDGVFWESNAALVWLGREHGGLPVSKPLEVTALNLLFLEATVFQEQAGVHFLNRCILPRLGKEGSPERVAKAHKKLGRAYAILEEQLGEQDYLLGDFSVVDCAFAPWLPWLDLHDHPALEAWYARIRARPSWAHADIPTTP